MIFSHTERQVVVVIHIVFGERLKVYEVGSELVYESAEGQSISERGAHVADAHISVSLALILTPLLERLDRRHPLQKTSLNARTHARDSLLNNRRTTEDVCSTE